MATFDKLIEEYIQVARAKRGILESKIINLKNFHLSDAPPHWIEKVQENLHTIYEQLKNDEKMFRTVMADTRKIDNMVQMIRIIREFKETYKN